MLHTPVTIAVVAVHAPNTFSAAGGVYKEDSCNTRQQQNAIEYIIVLQCVLYEA